MKQLHYFIIFIAATLMLNSCSKTGAVGPAGPTGAAGAVGPAPARLAQTERTGALFIVAQRPRPQVPERSAIFTLI